MLEHPGGDRFVLIYFHRSWFHTAGTEIPIDFVRGLVELRNAVKWNDLTELAHKDAEQLPRLFLGPDLRRDPNQRFVALRRGLICRFCNRRNHGVKWLDAGSDFEDSSGSS